MASRPVGSATPPPSPSIRTPPAPRLGFADSWEPYSPRKSARIASQLAANRIPSPRAFHTRLASPRTAKKADAQSNAAMVSPGSSPRKTQPTPISSSQASTYLTTEGSASAAAALGLNVASTSVSCATDMLPTPSKTPQKPPSEKTAANIQSFARNLFTSDEAMPATRKRRAKRYSAKVVESSAANENENSIEIFTDSQDRVPVKDQGADNPFYGDAPAALPRTRKSRRQLVKVPGEGAITIEEASRREDGMVYVFRGRKFFREFSKADDSQLDEQEASGEVVERGLTRTSVKPQLLFPARTSDQDDDYPPTEVEDMSESWNPQTPNKARPVPVKMPEAPKFSLVSPPDTKRTTRSTNKLAHEVTPLKSSGRRSPFDTWPRTKELKTASTSKRHGESLAASTMKRSRT